MVFSSQRPVILLILSYTLTTKFALKLLRHDKHVQTEKGHTFQQRIRGGRGWSADKAVWSSTIQALSEHEYFYIAE